MSDDAALASVLGGLLDAFEPIADSFDSPAGLAALLSEMGWAADAAELKDALIAFGALPDAARALSGSAQSVRDALAGGQRDAILAAVPAGLDALRTVTSAAQSLTAPVAGGLPAPLDTPQFWERFGVELLDFLLYRHLQAHVPKLFAPLRLLGIVRPVPAAADDPRVAERLLVDWAALAQLLSDPAGALARPYRWGTDFDHQSFLRSVTEAATAAGIPALSQPADADALAIYWDPPAPGAPAPALDHTTLGEVHAPLWWGVTTADGVMASAQVALVAMPIPPAGDRGSPPVGFAVLPELSGTVGDTEQLAPGIELQVSGDASTAGGLRIEFRPKSFEVAIGATGQAAIRLAVQGQPTSPWIILGARDGTRLELARAHVALAARVANDGNADVSFEARADEAALVIEPGDLDTFLSTALGDSPQRLDLSTMLAWSSRKGLTLGGSAGLSARIPVQSSIAGTVLIDAIDLALIGDVAKRSSALSATLDAALTLGPFATSVKGIGVSLELAVPPDRQRGRVGPVDLTLGFKPPTGVGVAIQSPAVSGGGFLLLDHDAGRYAGVFELTIVDTVSVKAIALITTKLPGGGFALLIVITAEGFTPIQLGMGFALTGIGGLLALNRTIDADAIRGGLQDGVLDSVLFVKDPVANANRVLATLDAIFPLAPDRLMIGPLAEISWGTPPLVKLRIALLLEVPQPIRAVLLAALSVALPRAEDAVVELHVDAIGVLDLGRGELALDASLHDSRLLAFTLTGDMALRLNWGSDPSFVLSVGGFHPRFAPPRGLRPLKRLALTLTGGDNPRVRLETYLALTSNTIQMGARVTVYAEAAGFGIDGGGSFDALIQWSPFRIDVAFAAWVRVFGPFGTLVGISVSLNITGPSPWHVTGKATIEVLFFSVHVNVDFTIGHAAQPTPVETVDVAALLWAEVSDRGNWHAVLPATTTPGATLASPDVTQRDAPVVAHPLAQITVRQRVVPLATSISRVGAAVPTGGTRTYDLDLTAPVGLATTIIDDLFAPAQYTAVSDDARLTGASFSPMPAGIGMRAATASTSGPGLACELAVETLDVSDLDRPAATGSPVAAVSA